MRSYVSNSVYRTKGAHYIYFIAAPDADVVKIGIAGDPKRRFRTIQACSPVRLELVLFVRGTIFDERHLHERFAAHRVHGEWFRYHSDILSLIERLARLTERGARRALRNMQPAERVEA